MRLKIFISAGRSRRRGKLTLLCIVRGSCRRARRSRPYTRRSRGFQAILTSHAKHGRPAIIRSPRPETNYLQYRNGITSQLAHSLALCACSVRNLLAVSKLRFTRVDGEYYYPAPEFQLFLGELHGTSRLKARFPCRRVCEESRP